MLGCNKFVTRRNKSLVELNPIHGRLLAIWSAEPGCFGGTGYTMATDRFDVDPTPKAGRDANRGLERGFGTFGRRDSRCGGRSVKRPGTFARGGLFGQWERTHGGIFLAGKS